MASNKIQSKILEILQALIWKSLSEKLMSELLRVIGDIDDIKPTGSGRNHHCYAVVSGSGAPS